MWQTQLCIVKKLRDLIQLLGNERFLDQEQLNTHSCDFVDASVQKTIVGVLEEDIQNYLDVLNKRSKIKKMNLSRDKRKDVDDWKSRRTKKGPEAMIDHKEHAN